MIVSFWKPWELWPPSYVHCSLLLICYPSRSCGRSRIHLCSSNLATSDTTAPTQPYDVLHSSMSAVLGALASTACGKVAQAPSQSGQCPGLSTSGRCDIRRHRQLVRDSAAGLSDDPSGVVTGPNLDVWLWVALPLIRRRVLSSSALHLFHGIRSARKALGMSCCTVSMLVILNR